MPRNVRNFWVTLDVDGSATRIATGPRSANGGFSLTVQMRDRGGIVNGLSMRGYVNKDGMITLEAEAPYAADKRITQQTSR